MYNYSLVKVVIFLLFTLLFLSCKKQNSEGNFDEKKQLIRNTSSSDTKPFHFFPTSTTKQIINHKSYSLSYSEKHEQPEWVAYELKKSELNYNNNNFKRPYFIEDPKVITGSADWKNYRRSGYDKGHLCPAGDRKFSKSSFDETFYTSNIAPQKRAFNEGVWNRLEQKVRYWAAKYDGVYVVTGGVLTKNLPSIGYEEVSIPAYFYKVLLDSDNGNYKMIAFLVPHEDSDLPLYEFVVPVDRIEQLTGIDFYPFLEDKTEANLERNSDYKKWSFN